MLTRAAARRGGAEDTCAPPLPPLLPPLLPPPPSARAAALRWGALLAACAALQLCCVAWPACAAAARAHVRLLAPRSLAVALAAAGPAAAWLLQAAWLRAALRGGGALPRLGLRFAPALFAAVAAFLACANAARFVRALPLRVDLDPSGHVLIIGVQLVPGWALMRLRGSAVSAVGGEAAWPLRAAAVLELLFWYVSACTAAFFHSFVEVALPWLAVAALALYSHAAAAPPVRRGGVAAHCWRLLAAGAAAWVLSLALLVAAGAHVSAMELRGHMIYDAAVLAAAVAFLVLYVHAHPQDG